MQHCWLRLSVKVMAFCHLPIGDFRFDVTHSFIQMWQPTYSKSRVRERTAESVSSTLMCSGSGLDKRWENLKLGLLFNYYLLTCCLCSVLLDIPLFIHTVGMNEHWKYMERLRVLLLARWTRVSDSHFSTFNFVIFSGRCSDLKNGQPPTQPPSWSNFIRIVWNKVNQLILNQF